MWTLITSSRVALTTNERSLAPGTSPFLQRDIYTFCRIVAANGRKWSNGRKWPSAGSGRPHSTCSYNALLPYYRRLLRHSAQSPLISGPKMLIFSGRDVYAIFAFVPANGRKWSNGRKWLSAGPCRLCSIRKAAVKMRLCYFKFGLHLNTKGG